MNRFTKLLAVSLLIVSALALLLAPLMMPASYSWLRHTTSESAAQGVTGAWLARLGFLIFGLTVLWLAERLLDNWPRPVRWLLGAFGLFMVGAAVFSSKPWLSNLPFDPVEDALHSFMATAMGFAFAFGVALRLWYGREEQRGRILAVVAVAASVAIPLAMSALPEWDGLLQRGMFTIAYIWYGSELLTNKNANSTKKG
jgi:hypothetical protein